MPRSSAIFQEEIEYVMRRNGLQNGWVVCEDVVDTYGDICSIPQYHYWREGEANFTSSTSLEGEKKYEKHNCHENNMICKQSNRKEKAN